MTLEEEDMGLALESCPGVVGVYALPPGGAFAVVAALAPFNQVAVAAVHYRILRALGRAAAARVLCVDATVSRGGVVERAAPISLSPDARARAEARAPGRAAAAVAEAEAEAVVAASAPYPPLAVPRALVALSDPMAVCIVEASFKGHVVVAHDPRAEALERISIQDATSHWTFGLVIAESFLLCEQHPALRGMDRLLFRPRGFAPPPVARDYSELAREVARR
jgi:hypothetical protein